MTTATPEKVSDWEDFVNSLDTPEKYAASVKDGSFKKNLSAYVQTHMAEKTKEAVDLKKEIAAQVQNVTVEMLKKAGASEIKITNAPTPEMQRALKTHRSNRHAIGAPINGIFEEVGDFFQAAWHKASNSPEIEKKLDQIRNYQEKVPSEGGILVPEEFRSEILRLSLESGVVRPRARVIPMGSATLRFPSIDSTSNVSSIYGGMVAYWTEEGAELVESAASFGAIKLEAWKLTALAHVTNELIRDTGGAFASFVESIMPEGLAWFEDIAFLKGNGVGEPLGALTGHPAMLTVLAEEGQAASTIVWENILKMYQRMLPTSLPNAVWIASPDTFFELATMALNVGTGGSAVWITDGSAKPQLMLLGRPVIMTEKTPAALGGNGDISFVDLSMYLIGDRQSMEIDSSAHVKFTSDKTTYRIISRVDGRPWLQSSITPQNNSQALSAFVNLGTRS